MTDFTSSVKMSSLGKLEVSVIADVKLAEESFGAGRSPGIPRIRSTARTTLTKFFWTINKENLRDSSNTTMLQLTVAVAWGFRRIHDRLCSIGVRPWLYQQFLSHTIDGLNRKGRTKFRVQMR